VQAQRRIVAYKTQPSVRPTVCYVLIVHASVIAEERCHACSVKHHSGTCSKRTWWLPAEQACRPHSTHQRH
jgi:hypothetical protein